MIEQEETNEQLKSVLENAVGYENLPETNIVSVNNTHKEEIARIRRIISFFFKAIEEGLHKGKIDDMPWEGKESVITVLSKLLPVFIRLIPMERNILGLESDQQLELEELDNDELLSPEDMEILNRYVSKQASLQNKAE